MVPTGEEARIPEHELAASSHLHTMKHTTSAIYMYTRRTCTIERERERERETERERERERERREEKREKRYQV